MFIIGKLEKSIMAKSAKIILDVLIRDLPFLKSTQYSPMDFRISKLYSIAEFISIGDLKAH